MSKFKRWLFYHIFKDQIVELKVTHKLSNLESIGTYSPSCGNPSIPKLASGHNIYDLDNILLKKINSYIVHQIKHDLEEYKTEYESKIYLWSDENEKE
jgi:hypothetical protein